MLRNATQRCSELYFEKETGTGSGTALMCGCSVVQARAAREKRQRQESQTRVANLATLFLDLVAFQTSFGGLNCRESLLTKPDTFSGVLENVGNNTNPF